MPKRRKRRSWERSREIALEVFGHEEGEVRCSKCGKVEWKDLVQAIYLTWPKCCGQPMKALVDSDHYYRFRMKG